MIVDPRTGEYRHPKLRDAHEAARLVDALSDMDASPRCTPSDVPRGDRQPPQVGGGDSEHRQAGGTEATSAYDCRKLIEMATVVAGGEDEFVAARSSASASAR